MNNDRRQQVSAADIDRAEQATKRKQNWEISNRQVRQSKTRAAGGDGHPRGSPPASTTAAAAHTSATSCSFSTTAGLPSSRTQAFDTHLHGAHLVSDVNKKPRNTVSSSTGAITDVTESRLKYDARSIWIMDATPSTVPRPPTLSSYPTVVSSVATVPTTSGDSATPMAAQVTHPVGACRESPCGQLQRACSFKLVAVICLQLQHVKVGMMTVPCKCVEHCIYQIQEILECEEFTDMFTLKGPFSE
eukprot:350792-Chlamydomonas_euryale.AAC.8